tara:strand:- start:9393 stop:10139 length:747 start_codon:yes stop_codon:yes gene_type:complete
MSGLEPIYPQITKSIIYELGIETTKKLNERQDKLESITWNNGEANLDTEYSKLACDCCIMSWDTIKIKYPEYSEIEITCIIPDINITFKYPDGIKTKDKIELKSSKSKKMPGSTIGNLDVNQTLIYCLRPSTESEPYKIRCSQYYSSMGESDIDLFQDRKPRPAINFEKMNEQGNNNPFVSKEKADWVEHYAKCALKRIEKNTICQYSWQDDMIKIIKKKIINDYVKNTSEEQFQIDKISLQFENIKI